MKWSAAAAECYVPDGTAEPEALARTTHLAVGAHQDDLEIMAAHGILACYRNRDAWFCGVTVTNGSGSPRSGLYGGYSDEAMVAVRDREQRNAAVLGEYGAQILLAHPSRAVKDAANADVAADLDTLLFATLPRIVYTHNLCDKHDSHVAVSLRMLEALRRLPEACQPEKVYGCEVWRDLDWMLDHDKIALDVSGRDALLNALVGAFDSQIAGGKRYDLAAAGRRRAHATYHASHDVDDAEGLAFAMDLTPLMRDAALDPAEYATGLVRRLEADVRERVQRFQ